MDFQQFVDDASTRDWDTDPEGTVRYAVVGLGGYARKVSLPAIDAGDYAAVGAVVSGDTEKADSVAAEYDAMALSYDDYAAGESTDAYDAVYVATPNRLHLDHIETAAAHDTAVITEKPLDATVERAERAVAACDDAGVPLMTAYRLQTDPVYRALRAFVAAGGIGEVQKLAGDFVSPVLSGTGGPDQWRLDATLGGGGALMDVGVYPLNTGRFLLGADPLAVSATGSASGPFGDRTADPDCPRFADEHVHFLTEFPNDVVGAFTASFSGQAGSSMELVGSEGRIRIEDAYLPRADRTVTIEAGGRTLSVDGLGADETREEFDYFAHCVLTGTPPEPDGHDGLVDMRVMQAVYDAIATGERVAVDAE